MKTATSSEDCMRCTLEKKGVCSVTRMKISSIVWRMPCYAFREKEEKKPK